MPQAIPNVIYYSQAISLLQQLQSSVTNGVLTSPTDIAAKLRSILTQFELGAGQPLLNYLPVSKGEPPLSAKMNSTWTQIQSDINILENQVDVLVAAALFMNNFIGTELLQAQNEVDALSNKLNTLELYTSSSSQGNLIVFTDRFSNTQLIDTQFSLGEPMASVEQGFLTLSAQTTIKNLSKGSTINILSTSNGFLGNNQSIEDPSIAPIDPTSGKPIYEFVAQINNPNDPTKLADSDPTTWLEYEYYLVNPTDKLSAQNFNFTYQIPSTGLTTAQVNEQAVNNFENVYGSVNTTDYRNNSPTQSQVDWSIGPPNGVLVLNLEFDLGSVQSINSIVYTPYGLDKNQNNPVFIGDVKTSVDGNTWISVHPNGINIGTNTGLGTFQAAANISLGSYSWSFENRSARYVRLFLEQSNPISCNIGHLYYVDNGNGQRVEGPVPFTTNPTIYYDPAFTSTNSSTQYREYFVGQRWVIGVTDFTIQQIQYNATSAVVSVPFDIGSVVNRVALDADITVPSDFTTDQSWVNFFISPDDGETWYPIAPIEDTFLGISQVIAFNDPLPAQFQEPGVAYYNTKNPVTSLRVKIELLSPNTTETPVVNSYSLKVTKQ